MTARGESGVAFVTEPDSGRWACCDDPAKVPQFIRVGEQVRVDTETHKYLGRESGKH